MIRTFIVIAFISFFIGVCQIPDIAKGEKRAMAIAGLSALVFIGNIFIEYRKKIESKEDKKDVIDSIISSKEEILSRLGDETPDPADKVEDGFSFTAILTINDIQEKRRKFIFDTGETENKNRVSLYLDFDDHLVFRAIDNNSETFSIKVRSNFVTFKKGAEYFLHCGLGISDKFSFMRVFLDDREVGRQDFDYKIDLITNGMSDVVIACDINKQNFGQFTLRLTAIGTVFTKQNIKDFMTDAITFIEAIRRG